MKREVILLGKGELAIRIAEWFLGSSEYRLSTVVPTVPAPAWTSSLPDWAKLNGIAIVEGGNYLDLPQLEDPTWRPDLVFSVFYDKIIRASFIDRCERILNLHNGPLPRYRGVSPINWALKNEESSHGVTIHEITPGIDDGPIISQVNFSIFPSFDEVIDVYRRALRFGWQLFQETMPMLDRVIPMAQDNSDALYYAKYQDLQLGDRRYFTRTEANVQH